MAPKRVETLQLELIFEEETGKDTEREPKEAAPQVPVEPPVVGEQGAGDDRRLQGLRAARSALQAGYGSPGRMEPEPPSSPGESSDTAFGVADFYERLRRAVRAGFPDEVWVTGEIRKVTVSKGHRYIELADHGTPAEGRLEGRQAATLEVACWARDWPPVAARLEEVGVELTAGLVVRLRGRVSIWEAGARVRFSLTELDVEALVGGIAAARRRLIAALEAEGVLEANKALPLPLVPLRVGLVTSASSEAYRDFTGQLQRAGYEFRVTLESTLVQGPEAPLQIARALGRLQQHALDLVVLVRGGGAKGDLAAFDHEAVARAIVTSRYPVWTGIGHTGDRSVADEVAQRALVTPTACGEAVVAAVAAFLTELEATSLQLAASAERAMQLASHEAARRRSDLTRAARHELGSAQAWMAAARARAERGAALAVAGCSSSLARRSDRLGSLAKGRLAEAEQRLGRHRAELRGFDPRRQLERGWSLTRTTGGRVVRSVDEVATGDEILSVLADGTVASVVRSAEKREKD